MGGQHSTVGRTKSLDEATVRNLNEASGRNPLRRSGSSQSSSTNRLERDQRSKSTLVIVHKPSEIPVARLEDDPLFRKLQELPSFVPLLHEVDTSSNIFGAKSRALAEIRGRVNPVPFTRIVRLYEDRLRRHADSVNVEQGRLAKCIRENDMQINSIFKTLTDRQKRFSRHAEHIGKLVDESKSSLFKCQSVLKECERNLQILNGMLTIEDRLEPFSWPEMFEDDEHSGSNYVNNIRRDLLARQESDASEVNEDYRPGPDNS